ncbi:acyl-CoA dehydrogenase family protein [Pseudomonas typographi]|uniref:Monooxygenase n=1 Tax=Pseudomonas typographi TaxID=2715964 RepID=A0ABR7YZR1_9PSED|nr:acyl-CoA dehydrogenase family protein [Pseudomonas typographi]MBD1550645.1 monooxygenase [Pseudomonas typographi]MBD1586770.1 monooxygenase [Pseudomonas typographi]MBD1598664.1 monooxygenase [Pseudomonas typographi]
MPAFTPDSPTAQAWGAPPSARYERLAAPFRPLFARIGAGAVEREVSRRLPATELGWLKDSGFTALRVPVEFGGAGASLAELFALLTELGQADSNLVQALRSHFGFAESILNSRDVQRRERWLERLGRGETVGPANSETGDAKREAFSTRLLADGANWRLEGSKFYTTGALFADWIDVGATTPDGARVTATVRRDAPGVEVVDDWNGFGQTLTASGTAHFREVAVKADEVIDKDQRFAYSPAFYQLFHLANLAGIGRAMSDEVARAVAARTRTFSIGNADRVAQDPQILAVVGQVRSAAYCAGAIATQNALALERAFEARHSPEQEQAVAIAELEVCQSLNVVSDLIIDAAGRLFDALGASATLRPQALDRFWRNARTLASHNPRVYKARIVGDFAVNGTAPPEQWKIGTV